MSDLKRFDLKFDSMSDCYCDVEADENGDYVLFEDVLEIERIAREYGKLKRNSIEESRNDKARIEELEERVQKVYSAGMSGINYVEQANYTSRAIEARDALRAALKEKTDE